VLLLALCGALPAHAAECVKTVRWNPDKTTSRQMVDGVEPSFNHDLVVEAFRRMGCTPRFVGMPWARALLELEHGGLDVLPGAFESAQRKRYALFSVPVMRSPNVLFARKAAAEQYKPARLADLKGTAFRLGAQIDVSYGQAFDQLRADPAFAGRLVAVSSRESAWRMMNLGRLDGLVADETVGMNEIRDLGLQQSIVKTRVVVANDATRVAFSKKSVTPEFVRAFDRAFAAMLADGSYKKMREQYVACTVAVEKLGCR
jgi:polar amino acid transport system substrate-binding protein